MTAAAATAAAVVALAAALRLAALARTPPDPYYDAAVRSMGTSWHALLFGAYEPGASVAIDKPPVDLWLQVVSTKLLGFGTGALLLPAALAGIGAVAAVFVLLRRLFGLAEATAGAAALAVLPLSVITSRSDTMDTLAAALAVGAAVLAVRDGRWALAGAGALIGLAFEVKPFQGLVPVPALVVLYLAASEQPWRERLTRLAIAGGVMVAVGLSWLTVVTAAPGRLQPWALGSTDGSAAQAMFVYDGLARIAKPIAEHATTLHPALLALRPDPPGPLRLVGGGARLTLRLGSELVPALLASAIALTLVLVARRRPAMDPHDDGRLRRAGTLGLAAWLLTGLVLFSAMRGLQARYLEAFAPAIAATLGVGVVTIARRAGARPWIAIAAVAALLAVPLQQSIAIARAGASDSERVGAMPAAEVTALSSYLARHDHGARYEAASATAVKAAALIVRDARAMLLLQAFSHQPLVSLARLEGLVRRGEVRYMLAAAGCSGRACGPATAWALRTGRDVTRAAGIPGHGVLYALRAPAPDHRSRGHGVS